MTAVSRYQSRRVDTASPVQLVVLLLEELLRRIELGAVAIESRKWRECTDHFHHARNVIAELLSALDPVPGVEKLVGDLDRLYVWSAGELTGASVGKDAVRARSVGRAIVPLLEAWRHVAAHGVT
jgi:flagellar biosynthetic protein FliS